MRKLRIILGLPFVAIGYILAVVAFTFCEIAYVIAGREWPFIRIGEIKND